MRAPCRLYGRPPYSIALLHGGPGAPGTLAPVARELSTLHGVLEPLQSVDTIAGQVAELHACLQAHAALPVTLTGHSWGAWLAILYVVAHPDRVRKLILVGSGPFTPESAAEIMPTRLSRLSPADRAEADTLFARLAGSADPATMHRLGEIMAQTDHYDPLPADDTDALPFQPDVHAKVWAEAKELRESGELLRLAAQVGCPVVAIHGDYDPHPAEGVRAPLAGLLHDFRFILLPHCGHEPWREREAKEEFYRVLREEALRHSGTVP